MNGRHALIGYSAGEFAAYWQWLSAAGGVFVNPENKARAIATAEEKARGRGRHVKEDS